ncbi:MAG TPA: hypothetical protein VGH28_03835 [Polyangiaceae bacterium]
MTTKPHHDALSIAQDATRVHDAAVKDLHDKTFGEHVSKSELQTFAANIALLQGGVGERVGHLSGQVAAGVHTAQARAAIGQLCRLVHAAAELAFENDHDKRKEFGLGLTLDESSTASMELYAHTLLAGAKKYPKDAAKAHLDAKGVRHLEDMLHALEGADIAHTNLKTGRHDASVALDSLAHVVSAEAARIRFVAKHAFVGDEKRLEPYANTLPRHEIAHRTRMAPPPTAGAPQ